VKYGVVIAGNFQHVTGYPVVPTYSVTQAILTAQDPGVTLTQGTQGSIYMAESGQYRLPAVNLTDIRISRTFTYKERYKFEPEFDMYNMFNQGTVIAQNASLTAGTATNGTGRIGSLFLNPTSVITPRLWKIGLRFDF